MGKIKKSDIIDEGIGAEFENIANGVSKLTIQLESLAKAGIKDAASLKIMVENTNDLTNAQAKNETMAKQLLEAEKELAILRKKADDEAKIGGAAKLKSYNKQSEYFKQLQKQTKERERAAKKQETIDKKEQTAANKKAKIEADHIKALQLVVKTEADAKRSNKALRIERAKVDKTTVEGNKTIAAYNDLINANTELLMDNTDNNQERINNIGKYKEALAGMGGAFGQAQQGASTLNKAFKFLLANPLLAIFSAVVAVIGAIGAAFGKTAKGAIFFAKVGAVVEGFMDGLVGIVGTLADYLQGLFNNPVQSLKDFGQALIDNVVNRFKAIVLLSKSLGKVLEGIFTMDGALLKEGLEESATASVQLSTGLDEAQQQAAKDGFKKLANDIAHSTKESLMLRDAKIQLAKAQRIANIEEEKAISLVNTFTQITNDATRSFNEREEASKQAADAQIKAAEIQKNIAKEELNYINKQMALNKHNNKLQGELLGQQNDAQIKLLQAENNYSTVAYDNAKRLREIKRDAYEQDLDILIDGFENQRMINERKIKDERYTYSEKKALLEQSRVEADESFLRQNEVLNLMAGKEIDLQDLVSTADSEALRKKIKGYELDEITAKRLFEATRERRIILQDMDDSAIDLEAERIDKTIRRQTLAAAKEVDIVKQKYNKGKINAKEYEAELLAIEKSTMLNSIEVLENLLKFEGLTIEQRLKLNEDLAKAKSLLLDEEVQDKLDAEQTIADDKKLKSEEDIERTKTAVAAAQNIINQSFDYFKEMNVAKLNDIEKTQQFELAAAGDNEDRKNAINLKYDKKRKELMRKQAIADKTQALFNIAISTAMAISQASPVVPLMAFAAAIGVAQAIFVAAKPIPKFAKGVKGFKGGLAQVSELGDEIIETPNETFLAQGEQVLNLPKNTNVYTAKESEQMLKVKHNISAKDKDNSDMLVQNHILKTMISEIKNKKEVTINIDKHGLTVLRGINNRIELRLNDLIN